MLQGNKEVKVKEVMRVLKAVLVNKVFQDHLEMQDKEEIKVKIVTNITNFKGNTLF